MKMFILIFAMFVIGTGNLSYSQEWAPDGAEWYYEYVNFWFMGYVHISVVGDTIINDTACRMLDKRSVIRNLEFDTTYTRYIGREYMFSENGRVYIFANDKFYALYDFTSVPGDTLIVPQNDDLLEWCNTEGKIIVTDTGSTTLNGQFLRKIEVQPVEGTHWAIYGEIIEKIGPIYSYMLAEPDWACVVDHFEGGRLRCYSDPDFGLYSTGISPECDYLVSIPEADDEAFVIYPNPCGETININIPDGASKCVAEIFDMTGQKVKEASIPSVSNQISMSDIKPGIYAIRIKTNNKELKRIIVKSK